MGTTHLFQFPNSATAPPPAPPPLLLTNHRHPPYPNTTCSGSRLLSDSTRCRSAGYGGRPHWDSNAEKTVRSERFRFDFDDEKDGGEKKRVWWSDDSMDINDDEVGFGDLEDSIDASWIFKILNAFGWMVPAIVISMLLGTGPNAFLMALVLPLAQSAVSFATDTFWGRSSRSSPKPKRRTKKKPFSRPASDVGMREEREDVESGKAREEREGVENYQSWSAANNISTKAYDRRARRFGGWDELDKRVGSHEVPNRAPAQKANGHKKGKLSRRGRNREAPLLLRLLIAVFPFLGSWMKFL